VPSSIGSQRGPEFPFSQGKASPDTFRRCNANRAPADGILFTPFTPDNHEALAPQDYVMTIWRGNRLELIG
jgi:hypothetical protein